LFSAKKGVMSQFDNLPDELVVAIVERVDGAWRPFLRMVCRRWLAVVSTPSRATISSLERAKPPLADHRAWLAGRVYCASSAANALGSLSSLVLSCSLTAASWYAQTFPNAPPCAIARALLASGRVDALRHALALDGDDRLARETTMAFAAEAAARFDRSDTIAWLLAENVPDPADDYHGVPCDRAWPDTVWVWAAHHNAGAVAGCLLDYQARASTRLARRLSTAWGDGAWTDVAGASNAVAVIRSHPRGTLPKAIAERAAMAGASFGHAGFCCEALRRACPGGPTPSHTGPRPVWGRESFWDSCEGRDGRHSSTGANNDPHKNAANDREQYHRHWQRKHQQQQWHDNDEDTSPLDTSVDDMLFETDGMGPTLGWRLAAAAATGRKPGPVLDWLEAKGCRLDYCTLVRVAILRGHACGRGALALLERQPSIASLVRDCAACAIGRAVSKGRLLEADQAVCALRPFVDTAAAATKDGPQRPVADLWSEIVMDVRAVGLTKRHPLDTLALLCAMAVRCGLGDATRLAVALGNVRSARVCCRAGWAHVSRNSLDAWETWCRPVPVPSRAIASLLRRINREHDGVGSSLVAWLSAAGLVSASVPL
jgi:hypothetical protein